MYALIEEGSKQYRVEEGQEIFIESLVHQGSVQFKKVLLVKEGDAAHVGAPYLTEWQVQGEVLGERKAPKVLSYKYTQRKRSRRLVGHRQRYLRVKITNIAKV